MNMRTKGIAAALLAATALAMPQAAIAQPSLSARLDRLEAEMASLRAELAAAKAGQAEAIATAQAAQAASQASTAQLAAMQAQAQPVSAAPAKPADGMRSGAATIRIGGYIKLLAASTRYSEGEVASNSLGRDFYLPQAIPTGSGPASQVTDYTAKQSRFWVNLATDVAGHSLKGYLETDFQTAPGTQGSQRTTNGYNLALRRAYLQFDKWTFGQDWTTFQYTGALPESTDYVGGAEGTVFVRQPLVRYSTPLSKALTLHVALENPESGTATVRAPALVENGDDKLPDLAARLAWSGTAGELSLAGLARQVRTRNAGLAAHAGGFGASAAGKLYLNTDKTGDVRFMATYGRNIGRYVGLNFAPDGVYDPAANRLASVNVFAALAAARLPLATNLRANLMGSYQSVSYADNLAPTSIATFNKRAWSVAGNLFWSPVKNLDLGIEARHGYRELVNGADGAVNRLEFAAKYGF